jgi:two-component system phosphate regulon sensor histidine kinase PhoR
MIDSSPREVLAALLDENSDPIFALDRRGTIIHANNAACAATGRSRDDLIGAALADLVQTADGAGLYAALQTVDVFPTTVEIVFANATGNPLTLRLRVLPDLAAGVVAASVTAQAAEQQVRDATMRDFLRNAAHQLRTPLAGIAAAVEVLQAGAKDDPAERDRFLEHIDRHSRRLIRMSHGLLVLARAQQGGSVGLESVELGPLLEDLVSGLEPSRGSGITVDCPPKLAALCDRDLVREAIAAILENSLTHTASGAITLSARVRDNGVAVEVTDTGGGVPETYGNRIFEPFFRPTRSGDGFGLGLAIAQQAVTAMNGELSFENVEGGARFTVRLPAAKAAR